MENSNPQMDDIPLLQEFADDTHHPIKQRPPSPLPRPATQSSTDQAAATPSPMKDNPFLPYEHLAQLAIEREQFRQNLEAFTENLKQERRYSQLASSGDELKKPDHPDDPVVAAIAEKVINHLKPIIEEQIRTELSLYLEHNPTDS